MKSKVKNTFGMMGIVAMLVFFASGCYETHYYHRYHHHTRGWYERRNVPPPAGVDFNVDVR